MGLLMLGLNRMIGFAPINILTVDADTHSSFLLDVLGAISCLLQEFRSKPTPLHCAIIFKSIGTQLGLQSKPPLAALKFQFPKFDNPAW
jgi:hypothetical protein